jgi:8-oxo-dGTP diphosphatase
VAGRDVFGDRLRVRVNAMIFRGSDILLVQIDSPTTGTTFWMPPGGGVMFGESLHEALEREVLEETGLRVSPGKLRYVTEYIRKPYHAVEFYYHCEVTGGSAAMGSDPELDAGSQIIRDMRWIPLGELQTMDIYPAFLRLEKAEDLLNGEAETRFVPSSAE